MPTIPPVTTGLAPPRRSLPGFLDRYTDLAIYGLIIGTVLCLIALLTNRVPDPSFPWATLPAGMRLPVEQPRIEHWPVTYTAGIWLWVFGFPAVFFWGYRRSADTSPLVWLAGLPVASMVAWTTYCRFFWPQLSPPTWNAPAYTFVCWGYCSTYDPFWSNLAYVLLVIGGLSVLLAGRGSRLGEYGLAIFGFLSLPLGLPALFEAYRRSTIRDVSRSVS